MSRLAVRLFGAPDVALDGVPIAVDTRKATALVAYLAMTGRRQARDALAGFLWPDAESGRAALRRTLSVLGKALGGRFLQVDRASVALGDDAELWVDVREFDEARKGCPQHADAARDDCEACLAALGRAADLYRGDFLEGFSLRDGDRFDEWRFFQGERLRRELGQVLQGLVRGQGARRDYPAAIASARRWLALDPLHEPAHRALMRLYARSAQRSAALRQYRECVRILDRELGVPPLDETTRLYVAIKEDRRPGRDVVPPRRESARQLGPSPSAAETSAAPSPAGGPLGSSGVVPLVGRDAESRTVFRAYEAARDGARLLVVEGEAGVGKTRLADATLEHAAGQGATVVAARCYPGEGDLAFGPFVDALRSAARRPDAAARLAGVPAHAVAEAARLLPEFADLRPGLPPVPPLDSPGGQSRFFDGVSQVLLAATAGSAPGVMLFDDLQWSDASSLQLIAYLARRMREQPRCLLLVWRTEDVPPGHPLRRILAEAEREGRGTAVILRRLDAAGVVALAAALRPAAPPPDFVERLFRETEGLPFFVVTYLRVLGEDPGLSSAAWPLPTGGRDFLRARLAALSGAAHQLLGAAAVIGRSFDFDTLRTTSGRSDEETLMALEELIARGVVVEADVGVGATPGPDRPHPGYDFCHEKLRSLVYDETSLARRRLLHRRVAGALVGQRRGGRAGSDLGTIAHHYQLAGLEDVAARYHRLAGERARSLYANREALAHFQAAIALGHPEPADLHEMIGDLLTLLGEFGAALRSYETAAAIAEPARVAGLERKLGTIYERRGEWELAESHFAIALDRLEAEGPAGERAQLFADWSLTAHRQGRSDRARGLASRALEFARDAGDRRALARAHNLLGILASRAGDLAGARRHLEDSLAISEEAADLAARTAALNNLALVCMQGGEVDRAIQLARTALALCRAQGDRHREAALHNNLADLHHARGDAAASLDHLRQAVAIYADIGVEAGAVRPEIWKLAEW